MNEPQGVSGGSSGRRAKVDCVPAGVILRISPVSARLTKRLPSSSKTMLSGASSCAASKEITFWSDPTSGGCAWAKESGRVARARTKAAAREVRNGRVWGIAFSLKGNGCTPE